MCVPKAPSIPPPPAAPEIPRAPTEVDPSILAARNRSRRQAQAASGFASTILTGGRGVLEGAETAELSLLGGRGASQASLIGRPRMGASASLLGGTGTVTSGGGASVVSGGSGGGFTGGGSGGGSGGGDPRLLRLR